MDGRRRGVRGWMGAGLLVGSVLAGSGEVAGQAVRGRVLDDDNGQPVATALVALVRDGQDVDTDMTGPDGGFYMAAPDSGVYQLRAERIGYGAILSQAFRVEPDQVVSIQFRIRPEAVELDPLEVTARSGSGRGQFYRRMEEWGRGVFMTPEMVDSIGALHPADILAAADQVDVSWQMGTTEEGQRIQMPAVRTYQGNGCVAYLVDGRPARPPPWSLASAWSIFPLAGVTADDIVATEIYRSLHEVPPELRAAGFRTVATAYGAAAGESRAGIGGPPSSSGWPNEEQCGVVAFWTEAAW